MKLGVLTVLFGAEPFEAALDRIAGFGLEAVEIGTGNYPGNAHCTPEELLADAGKLRAFRSAVATRGLTISALSCHGNPLHPRVDVAKPHHETFVQTVRLAEALGIDRICLFSGCPGDSDGGNFPNWVTCAWPPDYQQLLEWQWSEKVIPYWSAQAAFIAKHGVRRLAFEMHPGFVVYNPETLLRLRQAVGDCIGANFDPSHLFWQGINIISAIKVLAAAKAIFHVHAKDTYIDPENTAINGVLDTKSLGNALERSWIFRTVGYGHGQLEWRQILSALRLTGYDDVLSIEHEDLLLSISEGFGRAVQFLKECLMREAPSAAWWT
jgi:sugar phosphate isomerase/epimerase